MLNEEQKEKRTIVSEEQLEAVTGGAGSSHYTPDMVFYYRISYTWDDDCERIAQCLRREMIKLNLPDEVIATVTADKFSKDKPYMSWRTGGRLFIMWCGGDAEPSYYKD